jgi:hypothetical protein
VEAPAGDPAPLRARWMATPLRIGAFALPEPGGKTSLAGSGARPALAVGRAETRDRSLATCRSVDATPAVPAVVCSPFAIRPTASGIPPAPLAAPATAAGPSLSCRPVDVTVATAPEAFAVTPDTADLAVPATRPTERSTPPVVTDGVGKAPVEIFGGDGTFGVPTAGALGVATARTFGAATFGAATVGAFGVATFGADGTFGAEETAGAD